MDSYKTLASLHEDTMKDMAQARSAHERIFNPPKPEYYFRDAEDLAQCYAAWVEMELI